ncbi:MAG: hypothetical protein RMZ41_025510 [Nostoc sp. DedVER02]|uniref:hypothetical protein n=1 Tax=unclassified Nostoc TaxID=2593658 RepID=UPI002AD31D30|nr:MULTISPECIES: hypothetical protein [unclassified Nostoc]MDZ7987727.1 hypothetical protein [Nostoc sp. DedVER02]MDZ8116134.1 hypothetical protein [Nostoc sp. DedVER01b]
MQNFIVGLRSLFLGVGSLHWKYNHLQQVPKKLAERVIYSNGNGGNGNGNKTGVRIQNGLNASLPLTEFRILYP